MTAPKRIAMWSGPRNVSTALMRSFGSRCDAVVVDEPFYAHYLRETGLEHPGREEILQRHESDWQAVAGSLRAPLPAGKTLSYQKHMAHHLLSGMGVDWLAGFEQAFLIRDPRRMLPSLAKVLATTPRLEDTGLPQQVQLYRDLRTRTATLPAVVDSRDLLEDPPGILSALCERLGIDFDPGMLSWEPGPRDTDGCWGSLWYGNTWASTGFQRPPAAAPVPDLPSELEALARAAMPLYDELHEHRLTV